MALTRRDVILLGTSALAAGVVGDSLLRDGEIPDLEARLAESEAANIHLTALVSQLAIQTARLEEKVEQLAAGQQVALRQGADAESLTYFALGETPLTLPQYEKLFATATGLVASGRNAFESHFWDDIVPRESPPTNTDKKDA